jgi:DhnA family fructose-bisphosphate aldolase class Ia
MTGTGRDRRMRRVFGEDGRTVIVAVDHLSVFAEPVPALCELPAVIAATQAGGADGLITTRGALDQASAAMSAMACILSVPLTADSARHAPELALRLAADLVKVVFCPFTGESSTAAGWLSALITACDRWELPVMVETVPGGWRGDGTMRQAEALTAGARIAVELGASAIKTFLPLTGAAEGQGLRTPPEFDEDGMRELCRYVPVPVVVLGGDRTELDVLCGNVSAAVGAGAAGIAVGRNAWGHPAPGEVIRALAHVVHGSGPADTRS